MPMDGLFWSVNDGTCLVAYSGQRATAIMSLIQTAKLNGNDPDVTC